MTYREDRPAPRRPSRGSASYTTELADTILAGLMDGRTLLDICRGDGLPRAATVRRWVEDDHQGFAARYDQARQIGTVAMIHQVLEIAEGALDAWIAQAEGGGPDAAPGRECIGRALLRIEARCWLLAGILPGMCRELLLRRKRSSQ
jgi:hypothetical protein